MGATTLNDHTPASHRRYAEVTPAAAARACRPHRARHSDPRRRRLARQTAPRAGLSLLPRHPAAGTQPRCPLEHPLGGVALLSVLAEIIPQPLVDDLGEPVQLRSPDRRGPPISRRNRKAQHLPHALARDPKMARRRALAHAVPAGETHLPIKLHGEYAPALPVARKGQSGRVLLRPQRDHHAATVVDLCTAVLTSPTLPSRG